MEWLVGNSTGTRLAPVAFCALGGEGAEEMTEKAAGRRQKQMWDPAQMASPSIRKYAKIPLRRGPELLAPEFMSLPCSHRIRSPFTNVSGFLRSRTSVPKLTG